MTNRRYIAYVDGGCPGNGKRASRMFGSYVVYDVTGLLMPDNYLDMCETQPTKNYHEYLKDQAPLLENLNFDIHCNRIAPFKITNNVAELQAMHMLLSELITRRVLHPGNHVTIHCDSDLVVNQMIGAYKIKQPHLRTLHANLKSLLDGYQVKYKVTAWKSLSLSWIPGDTMKATRIAH